MDQLVLLGSSIFITETSHDWAFKNCQQRSKWLGSGELAFPAGSAPGWWSGLGITTAICPLRQMLLVSHTDPLFLGWSSHPTPFAAGVGCSKQLTAASFFGHLPLASGRALTHRSQGGYDAPPGRVVRNPWLTDRVWYTSPAPLLQAEQTVVQLVLQSSPWGKAEVRLLLRQHIFPKISFPNSASLTPLQVFPEITLSLCQQIAYTRIPVSGVAPKKPVLRHLSR